MIDIPTRKNKMKNKIQIISRVFLVIGALSLILILDNKRKTLHRTIVQMHTIELARVDQVRIMQELLKNKLTKKDLLATLQNPNVSLPGEARNFFEKPEEKLIAVGRLYFTFDDKGRLQAINTNSMTDEK